jgi:Trk K+ transport system NAD-binding subunit
MAGSSIAFTPSHVLAAVVAARASARIGPRIIGVEPLVQRLEVAEVRIHERSALANISLHEAGIDPSVHIVGRWVNNTLESPPSEFEPLQPGMLLVAVGSPEKIKVLGETVRPITQAGKIVVAGYGNVGSKLAEMLTDAGEEVCVINEADQPGVNIVGDVLETSTFERARAGSARAVILACGSDSTTLLAAAVVRDYAPDIPILACADQADAVEHIQQAGADFALSVSQVAGQFLMHYILGEVVSRQARIKLARMAVGRQADWSEITAMIRDRTGCTVIALERGDEILMEIPSDFIVLEQDALYVCGTPDAFERLHEEFPGSNS